MKKLKFFKGAKLERAVSKDDLKSFRTAIDILNYSSQRYFYTTEWADLISNSVKTFQDIIAKAKPDDLNIGMLEAYIDSQYNAMLAYIDDQRVEHEATLTHDRMILNGNLCELNEQIKLLDKDLAANEAAKSELLSKTAK